MVRGAWAVSARDGVLPPERRLRRHAPRRPERRGDPAGIFEAVGGAGMAGRMPAGGAQSASVCRSGADAQYVQLAADPENAGAEGAAADGHRRAAGDARGGARQSSGRVRPHHELPLLQRYQRHEPPASQRKQPDVPPGHQHPQRGRMDVRLAVGFDDVPPRAGPAAAGAARDGGMYAALLPDHERPRTRRGADHGRGGGVYAGPLLRRADRARERLCADRRERTGEHGALLRFSGVADVALYG